MLVAFFALSLSVSGCAGSDTSATTAPPTERPASQVALLRSADTLLVDRSLRLTAIVPASSSNFVLPVWSSSDTTVAVVTQGGLVFALRSGTAAIRVAVGSSSAATTLTVRPSLRFLRFEADTLALGLSQAVDLPYRAIDSDGNVMNLAGHFVQWSSSDPTVAPVSGSGGVTARQLGSTSVGLTVDGSASYIRVQVKPDAVASVSISPSPIAPTVGEQIQLTATASNAYGTVLPNRTITWSSSNSSVATVSASGVLSAVATGSAKITAVCENKRSALSFTVAPAGTPAPVDSGSTAPIVTVGLVTVTLSPSSILVGQTATASAVVQDLSGIVLTDRPVSWTSSDASVASVSDAGVVSGIKAGSAVITASVDGKAASAVVVVSNPVLAPKSITVLAPSPLKIGQIAQSTAIVKDANGTIIPEATVLWTSSPSNVVAVSANGATLGESVGTGTVSASLSGLSGSASITVVDSTTAPVVDTTTAPAPTPTPTPTVARVTVTLSPSSLAIGATAQAVAKAYDASGQEMSGTTAPQWTSQNTSVATVSSAGVVTAKNAGTTTITASIDGVLGTASVEVQAPTTTNQVVVLPGQSIQKLVSQYPAGTEFLLKAGTHTQQSVVPKDGNTFTCEAGAILDGQNATTYAFYAGTTSPYPNNVTISNCIVQNYTAPAQNGAIHAAKSDGNPGGSRWTVSGGEVRYNAGVGIRLSSYMHVTNVNVHHNHQLGIGGVGDSIIVSGGELAYNNYLKQYDFGWEAGGSKFVMTRDLIVRGVYVHDNWGPGLWTDIDNIRTLYENNRVINNADAGIFHEISYSAVIRNNEIRGNGMQAPSGWLWGAGIQIAASGGTGVEVYGNTLSGNQNGIGLLQQNRGSGTYGTHLVQNVNVHDNTVDLSARGGNGVVQDIGDNAVFTSRNNRFTHNSYVLGTSKSVLAWMNGWHTPSEWQSYGQDLTGTFAP